jgi:NAD(P)H-dependent flavin oxidoreductase YrpB (nitropropane dioxygenase family)
MHRAALAGTKPAADLAPSPVGQIVGSMNTVRSARDVVFDMVEEFVATTERLGSLLPKE